MAPLNHVVDGPDNAPVVVLGPSLGTDTGLFDAQVEALAPRWRVIRFDLPGHGSSPAPPGPYTIGGLTDALVETLHGIGIEQFHYAGVSIGGAIGQWLALHHGQRLTSLTICASAARYPDPTSWPARAATVRTEGTGKLADSRTGIWFLEKFAATRPQEAKRLVEMLLRTEDEGYAGCCEAIAAFDVREQLSHVTTPTLVMAGADDPATPVETVREIAERIPAAVFTVIPQAAHLLNVEQPDALNTELIHHLEQHDH
jgi:3-oxoadipate enol-lactonase